MVFVVSKNKCRIFLIFFMQALTLISGEDLRCKVYDAFVLETGERYKEFFIPGGLDDAHSLRVKLFIPACECVPNSDVLHKLRDAPGRKTVNGVVDVVAGFATDLEEGHEFYSDILDTSISDAIFGRNICAVCCRWGLWKAEKSDVQNVSLGTIRMAVVDKLCPTTLKFFLEGQPVDARPDAGDEEDYTIDGYVCLKRQKIASSSDRDLFERIWIR